MTTFKATFSNGQEFNRNNKTARNYSHAWATFTGEGKARHVGFSSSRAAAERAARQHMQYVGAISYEVAETTQPA